MSERTSIARDRRPLIAHVVFRFDYGGLENGVANIINRLSNGAFRHAVIALTNATDFRSRIHDPEVRVYTLGKRPGNDPTALVRLFQLLRTLRPTVVHSRNLGTVDVALAASLAGVPCRVHGEHGWDVYDADGTNLKYRLLRRLMSPLIQQFIAVSTELEMWLTNTVGIRPSKVLRIENGVDTERFRPAENGPVDPMLSDRFPRGSIIVGSVTRFCEIKDPLNLVRAFISARHQPEGGALRLVMIGEGALRTDAERMLLQAGLSQDAWLPGNRDDVPRLLRSMHVFALGSIREGTSNTVLEAMATGLPVVVTATGGNLELIENGVSGRLVPPRDSSALTNALLEYVRDPPKRVREGRMARARIEQHYSLPRMIAGYERLYESLCEPVREAA